MQHRRKDILGDAELVLEDVADRDARRHRGEVHLVEPGDRQLDQPQLRHRRHALVEGERDQHLGAGRGVRTEDLDRPAEVAAEKTFALLREAAVQHDLHARSRA